MAYHSSAPKKAQIYKKKLAKAYEKVKTAYDTHPHLFGKEGQKMAKKLASTRAYATNKTRIEQNVANKANAWREAKLEEYRRSKRQ